MNPVLWLSWLTVAGFGAGPRGDWQRKASDSLGRQRESCQLGESSQKVRDPGWGSQDGRLSGLCAGWGELARSVGGSIRLRTTCLREEGWQGMGDGRGIGQIPGHPFQG